MIDNECTAVSSSPRHSRMKLLRRRRSTPTEDANSSLLENEHSKLTQLSSLFVGNVMTTVCQMNEEGDIPHSQDVSFGSNQHLSNDTVSRQTKSMLSGQTFKQLNSIQIQERYSQC